MTWDADPVPWELTSTPCDLQQQPPCDDRLKPLVENGLLLDCRRHL